MSDLLTAVGVSVRFGRVRAVDDVGLRVRHGTAMGLIGPNGAGKTTLIDAITGFVRSEGSIRLGGREISGLAPHRRARAGVVRTWQSVQLFDDLDVAGNIAVAAARASSRAPWRRAATSDAVTALVDRLGLGDVAGRMPPELSHGQRRLVGVARALATQPALICLDEPAAGLDENESSRLATQIRAIVDAGTAVLLIEHDLRVVHEVCDEVCVLDQGVTIAQGPPGVVLEDPAVVAAYLGPTPSDVAAATPHGLRRG